MKARRTCPSRAPVLPSSPFLGAEAHGEVAAQAAVLDLDPIVAGPDFIHARGARPERQRSRNRLGQLAPGRVVVVGEETFEIPLRVDVLVQHGLQIARCAVVYDLSPIGCFIPGVFPSDERHRLREVEQGPEAPGDPGGAVAGRERRL